MTQLRLLEITDPDHWRLDERTRAIGRRGVAKARAALRESAERRLGRPTTDPADPPAPAPADTSAEHPSGRPAGRPDDRPADAA